MPLQGHPAFFVLSSIFGNKLPTNFVGSPSSPALSALVPARWPWGERPSTEEWHRTTKQGEANHEQSPAAPFECHDVRRDLWRRPGKSRTKKEA
jgi:hypothetical protein